MCIRDSLIPKVKLGTFIKQFVLSFYGELICCIVVSRVQRKRSFVFFIIIFLQFVRCVRKLIMKFWNSILVYCFRMGPKKLSGSAFKKARIARDESAKKVALNMRKWLKQQVKSASSTPPEDNEQSNEEEGLDQEDKVAKLLKFFIVLLKLVWGVPLNHTLFYLYLILH